MEHASQQFIECGFLFTADIEPFRKGRYTGPPESCYPDEGGTATLTGAALGSHGFSMADVERMFTPEEIAAIEEELYADWESLEDAM